MTSDAPKNRWTACIGRTVGRRSAIVVIVIAHLALTVLSSLESIGFAGGSFPDALMWEANSTAVEGFHQAQVSLIAVLAMLGSGWWISRLWRALLLMLWLNMALLAGSLIFASNRDSQLFEEFLGENLWGMILFAAPLLVVRVVTRRRLRERDQLVVPQGRIQFRIMHLLLVTTELAVLMALIRFLVPWNRNWSDQILQALWAGPWTAPIQNAVAVLVILPSIFAAICSRRRVFWLVMLLLYQPLLAALLAPLFADSGSMTQPGMLTLLRSCIPLLSFGWTASLTVYLTLLIVRRLDYDFLPLPRRGAGRHSSDATSAA